MRNNHKTLAAQNYSSTTTIGPRQAALIAHIAEMRSLGADVDLDTLRFLHGRVSYKAIANLRARALVIGSNNNLRLTKQGAWIGEQLLQTKTPMGIGFVAVKCPAM
jgi:hypothetical protein